METPSEIKNGQRELLKRFLEKDPECVKGARELLIQWGTPVVATSTHFVQVAKVKAYLKNYGNCFKQPELLTIQGIGLNNMCHNNAKYFCDLNPQFTTALGYNVCSCRCGGLMTFEIHTVVKDSRTGKYWDITKDYNKEEQKWFVPLNLTHHEDDAWDWNDVFHKKYNSFSTGSSNCKNCNITWKTSTPLLNAKTFIKDVKAFNERDDDDDDFDEFMRQHQHEMPDFLREMADSGCVVYM